MQQYYSDALFWDDADIVTVGDDGVKGIDFVIRMGGSISGKVRDSSTGLGIPGMEVHAGIAATDEHLAWTDTDANGDYTLRALPAGTIEIEVSGQGYLQQTRRVALGPEEHITGFDF